VLLDLSPLRKRDYRFLFTGQFVSALGSMVTYVALPVQIYQLTKSSAVVGLLGAVQLLPLALTALWGGAVADAFDRRRLLMWCELLLMLCALVLVANAVVPHPSVVVLFAVAAVMSAVSGFHSPALESLTPRLVAPAELQSVSALTTLRGTTAMIGGPALAGLCIAAFGVAATFALDALSYAVSLFALSMIRSIPPADSAPAVGLSSIREGLAYAASRPELIGTYVVDIIAMCFAMPLAVFPALADQWGGAAVGYLYSAMSIGAFLITLLSGWTRRVQRHGAAIILAATAWGAAIIALGYAPSLLVAVVCLAFAGAADAVSGIFRMTIWNETIPTELRGRMAAIEQLSYMTGPLLGNARVGFMAERFGIGRSITWGGMACVLGVMGTIPSLPAFWRYRPPVLALEGVTSAITPNAG
jgi:MFS family permease